MVKSVCVLATVLVAFLCGCSEGATTEMEPTPSRAVVAATPAPTEAETATTGQPATANPLQQSLEAFKRIMSVRLRQTFSLTGGEPNTVDIVVTLDAVAGSASSLHERTLATITSPEGIAEETFCEYGAQRDMCWIRVGTHGWTERISIVNPAFSVVAAMERELAATTIISTEVVTDTDLLLVTWRATPPPLGTAPQQTIQGKTWLDRATFLPMREQRMYEGAGQPLWSGTVEYREYDAAVTLTPPVVATVTPAPTVFIPTQTAEEPRFEELPFPGTLVLPDNVERAPAVILLHGSNGGGGLSRIAAEWGRRGFVALELCYYGCKDTPMTLNDIPVETVGRAVEYLHGRTDVDPDAIGVVGYSRGAEFALIAGVLDERIGAVVSMMGSHVVVPGYPNGGIAWTYEGKPLTWEVIPVERIDGPVLLLHGERDEVWPVSNTYHLADRLARHDRAYEMVVYPTEGHSLGASIEATQHSIAFMQRAFGR